MPSSAPEVTMTDPSPQPLFDEAIRAIQDAVSNQPWEDQKTFRHHINAKSLIRDLRSVCDSNPNGNALSACANKIAHFSRSFEPYFDAVAAFTQLRPDCSGWFWGLIGLVFEVGTEHVFFLEAAGDMFEKLAQTLPRYKDRKTVYKSLSPTARTEWLLLLSCVYADIVQFCLELYWNPVTAAQWKRMDSRFEKLRQRLENHTTWIVTGMCDQGSLTQYRNDYFDQLQSRSEAKEEAENMAHGVRRVDEVISWMSSDGAYQSVFQHRCAQVLEGTCNWFLETPDYCRWKRVPFEDRSANDLDFLRTDWHRRVLFVQAPSGFGKTCLSIRVIQDLSTKDRHRNAIAKPAGVAFFHFTRDYPRCADPADAFRALAVQLAQCHGHDSLTMDALLARRETSTRSLASLDDVLAVLSLLLQRHPTFIVLDEVDDCSDQELLLTGLSHLCRRCDARVIVFSRLGISIPLQYQNWASNSPYVITLSTEENRHDVERYLMVNLGPAIHPSGVARVAESLNGSFLGASLLVKYLQSPHLLPPNRLFHQIHQFADIPSLYGLILTTLDRKPDEERQLAADAFCWLSCPVNPLSVRPLLSVLAVTSGRDRSSEEILAQLPAATCGLIDISDHGVHFTHRSVREYLQSADCPPQFNLSSEGLVHGRLAARCLSYLTNCKRLLQPPPPPTPPRPHTHMRSSGSSVRTGSSTNSGYRSNPTSPVTEDVMMAMPIPKDEEPTFDESLPFLRYATLCWPIHLARALAHLGTYPHQMMGAQEALSWLPALSRFLADRAAVTTWAEASWHYSLPPNVSRIVPLIINVKLSFPVESAEYRELSAVVAELRDLNSALEELRERHVAAVIAAPDVA